MPYCPKCDMEFVEGVTICTDCGSPLLASREEAELQKAEEPQWEAQEQEPSACNNPLKSQPFTHTYVKKSQKLEDMKASVSAFYLVGALLLLASVVLWSGILSINGIILKLLVTVMGVGALVVGIKTSSTAKALVSQVTEEDENTNSLISWFLSSYTGSQLDDKLQEENQELSPEELSLKRFELIQDLLITHHDLADQSYVEFLSEEIYNRLYEE